MFVVLDTSIVVRDFLLRGKAFQVLLGSLGSIPARLCVPEIVIDEAVNKYREKILAHAQKARSARRRLDALLLASSGKPHEGIDEATASKEYEEHLRERFASADAKFLPYPQEPHRKVVEHALLRRKPFDKSGRGYRDYLIWISLRSEMYYAPEESVVLITGNTKDFCDGDQLATSLADEAARYHHPGVSITVCSSLDAFNAQHVVPRLVQSEGLVEPLVSSEGHTFDLRSWAVANLQDLLRDEEYIVTVTHGLEPQHADCYVSAIDTIGEISVDDIRVIDEDTRLVACNASIAAILSLDVDWKQYSSYHESRELLGSGLGESESASWYEPVDLQVHFSIIADLSSPGTASGEIDAIRGRCGEVSINELPRHRIES